jgi:hypothetical protein
MKLLRLETDSNQGQFETDFSEDITIGANSQIALHSISAELDSGDLEINSSNNIIKYKLGTDAEKIVTLTNKKYTKPNIHELFNDIQQRLNDSLDGSTVNNGSITFFCNNNGFISIGNDRNKDRDFDKPNSAGNDPTSPQQIFVGCARTGNTAATNTGQQIFSHSGSDTALNNRYFYQSNIWAKGSAIFRAKIQKFVDNASGNPDNGFRMCLLDIDPASLNGAAIPEGNIITSIEFQRPTENYLFKRPGDTVQIDSGQLPVKRDDNDFMEIAQRDGNIEIRVYVNNQLLPSALGQAPIPRNTDGSRQDLYPVIIIYGGSANLQITDYRCSTKEPVINNAIVGSDLLTGETLGAYPPVFIKKYSKSIKDFTLTIPNSDLYNSLGFENFATTGGVLTNTGIHMDITSSLPFHMTSLSDAIIVDMVNMELDAYDSIQKGHKNILNVIALSDNQTNINYELRNLVFVDMKNKNPRLLRHIKARLLRHDLTPLPTRGKSSLVLLIK